MIWTFYSYKGGVGRSMALANVAEWLYLRKLRVAMVDWDLEAPGLERYFRRYGEQVEQLPSALGLMDLLGRYQDRLPLIELPETDPHSEAVLQALDEQLPSLDSYVHPIHPSSDDAGSGALYLLPAGWRSEDRFTAYAQAVQNFDWSGFYTQHHGELFFAWLRWRLLQLADVVLIDSRTGISEMSGPGTRQMADVVVSLCAPNHANLDGVVTMSHSFAHPKLVAARGRDVQVVIVPSRIDNSETDKRNRFELAFRERADGFTPAALRSQPREFWDLRIPYIPKYAYDEEMVIGVPDRAEDLEQAYDRLAISLLHLAPPGTRLAEELVRLQQPSVVPEAGVRRPAIWNAPARNPLFLGRARELDELRARLTQPGSRVAVWGVAGLGKSDLAAEYVHRFGASYEAVCWVDAATRTSIATDLQQLVDTEAPADGLDPAGWLARHEGWLLVLDDADPVAVGELLASVPGGHVIVTSRSPNWSSISQPFALAALSEQEGAELLLRRTGQSDRDAALAVSSEVGGLPLALRIVADYVEASGRDLKSIRELLDAQPESVLQRRSSELAEAFERSFTALAQTAPDALELLTLTAFMGPGEIPLDLLAAGAARLPGALGVTLVDPGQRDDAVIALREHSLLDARGENVLLHPIVRMLVRGRLRDDGPTSWAGSVIDCIEEAFPSRSRHPSTWATCARLAPHAVAVASRPPPSHAALAISILTRCAAFDDVEGRLDEALSKLELARGIGRANGTDAEIATACAVQALLQLLRGDDDRAEDALEAARIPIQILVMGGEVAARVGLVRGMLQWHRGEQIGALSEVDDVLMSGGSLARRGHLLMLRSALLLELGRTGEAERDVRQSLEAFEDSGEDSGGAVGRARALGARLIAARQPDAVAGAMPALDGVAPVYAAPLAMRYAQIHLQRGEMGRAEALLDGARKRLAERYSSHPREGAILLWLAVRYLAEGARDRAQEKVTAALRSDVAPASIRLGLEQVILALDIRPARGLAFSPDGLRLAVAHAGAGHDGEGTIVLWDVSSGQQTATLKGHSHGVNAVAFSPDGRMLASAGGDQTVVLWDLASGQRTALLEGHFGAVNSIAYSPDGGVLASASSDRTVRLWDTSTGRQTGVLEDHSSDVNAVAYSPDGKWLASAGSDGVTSVVDTASALQARGLKGNAGAVNAVAFSPDGESLASAGANRLVGLWGLSSDEPTAMLRGHAGELRSLAFSPDGASLATAGSDGTVGLWDTAGAGVVTLASQLGEMNAVAFAPDGQTLAGAGSDGLVRIWDPVTKRLSAILGLRAGESVLERTSARPVDTILEHAATVALEHIERHDLAAAVVEPWPADPSSTP